MAQRSRLKRLTAVAIVAAVILVSVLLMMAADSFLTVWERLDRASPWLGQGFLVFLALAAGFTAWTVWQLLRSPSNRSSEPTPSLDDLDRRIKDRAAQGVDVSSSQQELSLARERQSENVVYIALFGEASSGKSSLINALLPGADAETGVITGTTRSVRHFDWRGDDNGRVRLADLPGFGQAGATDLAEQARDEAIRAHLVLYVCDGDLTRAQFEEVKRLSAFDKPLIVVLNKADQMSTEELGAVESRIRDHLESVSALAVVAVTAGGQESVVIEGSDGSRRAMQRPRDSDLSELIVQIEEILGAHRGELADGQRTASLRLANAKLAESTRSYRRSAAETLVERYARRAVLGALAAVTPGTDIVIQSALAASLIRELTRLYEVPLKELDVDRFIELAGGRVGRASAIVMAVAGNALKAFPGVGTLAGGVVHAVAYGLIFDSLGRAVAHCLDEQAEFDTETALEQLEGQLERDLATRAKRLARLALSRTRR